jgi:hypothetical protein|tara:strand:+ start:2112 stop:2423 length:312 start_codon:yes stop_codon:yes gene_type:complete
MKIRKRTRASHKFLCLGGYFLLNPRLHLLFHHGLSLCIQSPKTPMGHIKHQPRPTRTKSKINSPHHIIQKNTMPKFKAGFSTPYITAMVAIVEMTSSGATKRN